MSMRTINMWCLLLVFLWTSCATNDPPSGQNTEVRSDDAGVDDSVPDLAEPDVSQVATFYNICILGEEAPLSPCLDTDILDFGVIAPGSRETRRFAVENMISDPISVVDFELLTSRRERFATEIFRLNNVGARVSVSFPVALRAADRLFVDITYEADAPSGDIPIDDMVVSLAVGERMEEVSVPTSGSNGECSTGTADCDPELVGCETDTTADARHCGGCGASCGMGNMCLGGACSIVSCPSANLLDCDGQFDNGCETSIISDALNCGGCGAITPSGTPNPLYVCPGEAELNAVPLCDAGMCGFGSCSAGFDDCTPDPGCETLITTVENCGGCGNLPGAVGAQFRCADVFPNVQTSCTSGQCDVGPTPTCEPGWYDLDNDIFTNGCEYFCMGSPTSVDVPDAAYTDANCDGIDGDMANAVFVSPLGRFGATGAFGDPMADLNAAVSLAGVSNKDVYMAGGVYSMPSVQLVEGVSIYAGFDAGTWVRGAGNAATIQNNGAVSSRRVVGAIGNGLAAVTILERLKIQTPAATQDGVSNYGLHCINCGGLRLVDCEIIAGAGSSGSKGGDGTDGTDGDPGFPGGAIPGGACQDNGCGPSGGGGGASPVGNKGGSGGAGGNSGGIGGCGGATNGVRGSDGLVAALGGGGGPGGAKGDGGADGVNGQGGTDGTSGGNGAAGDAKVVGGFWAGADGLAGGPGTHGGGGGGGGGGGAHACTFCDNGRGNGGGGGGGGGQRGTAGGGGRNGGGSFGVFLVNSTGVQLFGCTISSSDAGDGGAGGTGGKGGTGGTGGAGPNPCNSYGGKGGNGGRGGNGGDGGAGGGGDGGPSYAVYLTGTTLSLISNTLSFGAGGAGGSSVGASGAAGLSGNRN